MIAIQDCNPRKHLPCSIGGNSRGPGCDSTDRYFPLACRQSYLFAHSSHHLLLLVKFTAKPDHYWRSARSEIIRFVLRRPTTALAKLPASHLVEVIGE
ncbi:hypothetical protein D3C80_1885310 [compost metagenome]